jgi:hypothetical protein
MDNGFGCFIDYRLISNKNALWINRKYSTNSIITRKKKRTTDNSLCCLYFYFFKKLSLSFHGLILMARLLIFIIEKSDLCRAEGYIEGEGAPLFGSVQFVLFFKKWRTFRLGWIS